MHWRRVTPAHPQVTGVQVGENFIIHDLETWNYFKLLGNRTSGLPTRVPSPIPLVGCRTTCNLNQALKLLNTLRLTVRVNVCVIERHQRVTSCSVLALSRIVPPPTLTLYNLLIKPQANPYPILKRGKISARHVAQTQTGHRLGLALDASSALWQINSRLFL